MPFNGVNNVTNHLFSDSMRHAYIFSFCIACSSTSTRFHSQTICDLDVIRAVCALIEFLAMRKRSEGWRGGYHHVLCRRLQPSHDLLQSFYYSLPSSIKPPHREFGGSVSPFFLCIHVMHQSMCLNVYVYLDVSVNA